MLFWNWQRYPLYFLFPPGTSHNDSRLNYISLSKDINFNKYILMTSQLCQFLIQMILQTFERITVRYIINIVGMLKYILIEVKSIRRNPNLRNYRQEGIVE